MGRHAGSLVRATCSICGKVEMATGTSHMRRCEQCKADGRRHPSKACYAWHPGVVAKAIVNAEVAAGRLPRVHDFKCVDCGAQAAAYDHRDYAKPLQVEPVCKRCNSRRGPALNHLPSPTDASGNAGSPATQDTFAGSSYI